jgi:hypothetical protein
MFKTLSVAQAIIISSVILSIAILISSHPYSVVRANDLGLIKLNNFTGAVEVCSIRKTVDWYEVGCAKSEAGN